jgi:hypothetical protein
MRLSTWMNPLPGAEPSVADRLVALRCAMQITPNTVLSSGASEAGEITTVARRFGDWLAEASDDNDRIIRRAVLVMVCDKADEETTQNRLRPLMKELHHLRERLCFVCPQTTRGPPLTTPYWRHSVTAAPALHVTCTGHSQT